MSPSKKAQPAYLEEYDEKNDKVKAGGKVVEARCNTSATRNPLKSTVRRKTTSSSTAKHVAASDSGYSSHTSLTQASNGSATARPAVTASAAQASAPATKPSSSPAKARPSIPRIDTHPTQSRPSARRSSSTSRRIAPTNEGAYQNPAVYPDPHSGYPISPAVNMPYTPQYHSAVIAPYHQTAELPYSQIAQVATASPLVAQPRPRPDIPSARIRPTSLHSYSYPDGISNSRGPPPSASAYQSAGYEAWAREFSQANPLMAYAMQSYSGDRPVSAYPTELPPMPASPLSPQMPDLSRTFSARVADPGYTGYQVPPHTQPHAPLTRTLSARQTSGRMSGSFPSNAGPVFHNESDPETGSSSDSEAVYERSYRDRRRSSQYSRVPSPSNTHRLPTRTRYVDERPESSVRESSRRQRPLIQPDPLSSSDTMDSDRTARAVVDRRTGRRVSVSNGASYDRARRTSVSNGASYDRAYRPSISNGASSDRTRENEMASASGSRVVVEDRRNRRSVYLSKEEQIALHRQRDQDAMLDQADAYQQRVSGPQVPELTAENIRRQQRRTTVGSQASARSSRSGSKAAGGGSRQSGAIRIQSGNTVVEVPHGTTIALHDNDDGNARLVIGESASQRRSDSAYYSSQKSGSTRHGHSRGSGSSLGGRRRRDTIIEDGYEPGL